MKAQTQIDSWHRLYPKMPDRAAKYLAALCELGSATNREVARHLGSESPSDWTSARAWLHERHIIGEQGSRRCSITGERVTAYVVSEAQAEAPKFTATSEQRQRLVNAKREAIWARDAGCQQAVRVIEIVDGILEGNV